MYNLRLNDRWRHWLKEMSVNMFYCLSLVSIFECFEPTITFWWEIFNSVNAKNIQAFPYVPIVWMMKFSHKTPTLFIGDS